MIPAQYLKSFALKRKRAYETMGYLHDGRSKAIGRILKVCQFFNTSKKYGWIKQIEGDILEIIPDNESRFTKERERVLEILEKSKKI